MNPLRQQIVEEAKSWVGTPFVHEQCIKGVGCDCVTILCAIYERLIGRKIDLPHYDIQWNLHNDKQPYLTAFLEHSVEVSAFPAEEYVPEAVSKSPRFRGFPVEMWNQKPPLPADIGFWWFGRAWAHATIIIDWPTVLNPMMYGTVALESAQTIGSMSERAMRMRLMRPKFLL